MILGIFIGGIIGSVLTCIIMALVNASSCDECRRDKFCEIEYKRREN